MTTLYRSRPPDIGRRSSGSPVEQRGLWQSRTGVVAIGILLLVGALLLFDYRLRLLGYLPLLLLLACPLLHLLRGHGHGSHGRGPAGENPRDRSGEN